LIKFSIRVESCLVLMLSVSAACQDFPKPFSNNGRSRGVEAGKKEIYNYLLWGLDLCNEKLVVVI